MNESDIRCPFCGEGDMDLVGLKNHLNRYCEAYNNTETIEEERERKRKERDSA